MWVIFQHKSLKMMKQHIMSMQFPTDPIENLVDVLLSIFSQQNQSISACRDNRNGCASRWNIFRCNLYRRRLDQITVERASKTF